MARGPFHRRRGGYSVALSDIEAAAIRRVADEMLQALRDDHLDDPVMRRLFPPAYPDDVKLQDEFLRMTHDDSVVRKRDAARAVVDSIDRGSHKKGVFTAEIDDDQMRGWLGVINDARLVLGATLEVTEEMDQTPLPPEDPRAPAQNMYLYLSSLEWHLIETLSRAEGFGSADTGFE